MAIRDRIKVIPEHGKFSVYLDGELRGVWDEEHHADIYVEGILLGIFTERREKAKIDAGIPENGESNANQN